MKDGLKSFKNHFKGKSSQTSSRAESPIPTDAAISHPNKEIHEPETRLSSPPRVGMSESNEPTNPIRMSSSSAIQSDGMLSKPSQDTTSQRGYDNGNTSSKLWPKPITHVADNEANTEAATDSQSGNDPEELSSPDQLWAAAYKRLENDHPKLLYDYQKFLLSTGQNKCNQPKIDDGGWQTQIQKLAYERLEESQQERLSFQIREKDIIIRDQIQKAMSFIVSVKDVVGTAISSEPHAALGWAGAMFIFPLLKTMLDQDKYAIEGFDCSLSLLVRCELIAQDFMKQAPSNLNTIFRSSRTSITVLLTDEFKATEGEIRNDLQVLSAHKVKEIEERFGDFLSERQKLFEQYQTITGSLKTGFTDSSQLSGKIYLGGTFFFKQDDTSRNQANVLFTTLAHQLAYKQFGLGNEIAKAIKTNASPSIGFRSLEVQWEELILKPLQTVQESFPGTRLVLIIDALDECQHKETRTMKANIRGILQSLEQLGNFTTNMQVRVLVTSRNESHISKAFELLKDSYEQVELPKVELDSSNNDITTFLENNLYQNENGNSSGMEWLGRGDFDKLVQKSGGLFIYAATACKFLGGIDEPKIAEKRLRMLLEGTPGSKSPESNLDDIYRAVLDSYTRDWTEDEKKGGHLLKEILGLIAILFKPLPIYSLAEFTTSKYEEFKVKERLDSVRSIVEVPGDREVPVSLVHLSFHEFFMDKRRCERTKFYVEPSIMHSHLLQRCLKIMSQQLHMDMCDLRKPGILFVEVPPTLVQQFISPHLQYACRYWVDHLLLAREARLLPNMLTDNGEIHKFLKTHILNWLEVLGLIGDIGSAVYAINHLRTLVNTSTSQELSGLLYDSYRFTLFNIPIIRKAPLQVHYSSVLFSPSASIVRHLFLEPLTEWIKLLPHVNETWGAELMTINTRQDELIDSIVSPDSKTIASLKDSVVYLWEAVTGIEITKIDFRPTDYVEVTSFSPDGKYIALDLRSGVVRLYDIETSETSDLLGHETCIKGLAFPQSPSSKLLASVSFDGSGDACFIWDVSRKEQILTIKPPEDYINKVAILPGNLIAIVSSPRYIREDSKLHIWDLNTRKSGVGLDLDGYAQRIAFSPDGDTVAVETFSKSINIYSTKTWCLRFTLPHDDDTYNPESVAFSSDGKLLMVYYRENRISLHNSDSGELIRKLYIEGDWLYAVFFPDGETLATTSWNQFRLWDLTTANEKKSSQDTITRLQLSHSGNNAMVGFKKRFMIWNLNESKCILEIPHKLLPSSNSRFALSRPDDYSSTYDIWCTETGNRLKNFPAIMGGIHFSPYGKIVAFTSPNSIRILEVDTWEECARFNFESNESLSNIYFSTDNKVILCAKRWIWNSDTSGSDTTVFCLITLETHDPYHLIEYDPCCTPRLSPDGTLVAFLPKGTRGYIHLLEVDTKKVRAKLQYSENSYTKILFSPDSTLIAVSHGERDTWFQVTLWNTAHGDMMSTSQRTDHEFIFMAVGPGGRVLITNQGDLSMWDPETNEVTGLAIFPPYDIELEEGGCLVSRYGRLPLPFTAKDFDCIYVDDDWVLQGGERLLWLPEAYRSKYFGISNDTLVRENTIFLSHESGFLAYIQINLENTPLAKQHKESLQVKQIGVEVTEVE
ncbi:hypothetical protein F4774DRAFT_420397 [Daldinia eschscholtzii]|nr:hypothetical protein F4774DRAFT_420397 [Daldinia eschscholtzii]